MTALSRRDFLKAAAAFGAALALGPHIGSLLPKERAPSVDIGLGPVAEADGYLEVVVAGRSMWIPCYSHTGSVQPGSIIQDRTDYAGYAERNGVLYGNDSKKERVIITERWPGLEDPSRKETT